MKKVKKYSVVIPTLNAQRTLPKCLSSIKQARDSIEVIVVDGGSNDRTMLIGKDHGARMQLTNPARGLQMHTGANLANGDIILFLHADTLLPQEAFHVLDEHFADNKNQISTFRLKFDCNHWLLNLYGKFTKFDSLWTSFGDQGIAIRKEFYKSIGGFPQWRLFEDVELLRRARRLTKIHSLNAHVITSSNRFLEKGLIKQQIMNGWFIIQFLRGESIERLSREYNR